MERSAIQEIRGVSPGFRPAASGLRPEINKAFPFANEGQAIRVSLRM